KDKRRGDNDDQKSRNRPSRQPPMRQMSTPQNRQPVGGESRRQQPQVHVVAPIGGGPGSLADTHGRDIDEQQEYVVADENGTDDDRQPIERASIAHHATYGKHGGNEHDAERD